ncbi:MAG: hypothetical protein J3R72DRAFT_121641 [Linnemannia gamsii]|nr:MAG: hypothetical protein J3R72DRAFT_121641 [Linnemannia gamsii]
MSGKVNLIALGRIASRSFEQESRGQQNRGVAPSSHIILAFIASRMLSCFALVDVNRYMQPCPYATRPCFLFFTLAFLAMFMLATSATGTRHSPCSQHLYQARPNVALTVFAAILLITFFIKEH